MGFNPISVTLCNEYIGRIMQTDPILNDMSVIGEISNLKYHANGHVYFYLKDSDSRISCVIYANTLPRIRFELADGMEAICHGRVGVWKKSGTYNLTISDMDAGGEGELAAAFERLKIKLEKEGLFREEAKKEIPQFPERVAIITSPSGAVVWDIISTVRRRNPMLSLDIYPSLVQGKEAAPSIVKAIKAANGAEGSEKADIIILARGGGSIEDLWPFNEEAVARAVFDSEIPVISAIGHETDTVMTDLTSDRRCETPTAAAEFVSVDIASYIRTFENLAPARIKEMLSERLSAEQRLCGELLGEAAERAGQAAGDAAHRLEKAGLRLEGANPMRILRRGFAAVSKADGTRISECSDVERGELIDVRLSDGKLSCEVVDKRIFSEEVAI